MYNQAPLGNNIWLAEDNGKIVGQYCSVILELKFGNKIIRVAHSLDTLTHPHYRRQGIMLTLSKKVFEELAKNGIDIIYGFPNDAAYPNDIRLGFSKVSGTRKIKRVFHWKNSLKTRINNRLLLKFCTASGNMLTKVIFRTSRVPAIKGLTITQISSFDDRVNKLWNTVSSQFQIIIVRNKDFLNWRYSKVPNTNYSIFVAEKEKAVVGYLVLCYSQRDYTKVAVIYDLIAESAEVIQCLLFTVIEKCRKDDIDYIYSLGTYNKIYLNAFRRQGFFLQRFDKGIRCVAMPIDPSISKEFLSDPQNWFIQIGDSDQL